MKIFLKPLYSKLNQGLGSCPLGCIHTCRVHEAAPTLKPPDGQTCPLSSHQAETYAAVMAGDTDITINESATGDGKSLGGSLPSLLNSDVRMMGLYPTIELVEDQAKQQEDYHQKFGLDAQTRIDRLFGAELSRRVAEESSNKFLELWRAIEQKPVILTNPDIFHLITHYQYRNPAYDDNTLPLALAEFPDLWVFDEFHIFGPHQEAAAVNSLCFIRQSQQGQRKFLFTSATPKSDFIHQLRQADFQVTEIKGVYASEATPGYRPILQPAELEFINLKNSDTFTWLTEQVDRIRDSLTAESSGRGLIILNSVAAVGRVVRELSDLLPEVTVREISGRIDRKERSRIQADLQHSPKPVLVVATSAVDVGVDFRIHLLIFESSDASTVVQRLGRLGRHPGFSKYQAFILIPGRTPWVMARLEDNLKPGETVERQQLQEAIATAFNPPQEFTAYRKNWGALQAQGMFAQMTKGLSRDRAQVSQQIRDRMTEDLQRVYSKSKLESARKRWLAMSNDIKDIGVGKEIQTELLRFRGGTAIQAAIWDETGDNARFYSYDLLRLLPYAMVEICDRETFLQAAAKADYSEYAFPKPYIQVYLRVRRWVDERINLTLHSGRDTDELNPCELSLCDRLTIVGHPNSEVGRCLNKRQLLTFLVPVNSKPSSHWDVSRKLHLSPLFGLYRLTDAGGEAYACAFNQDALLLDALKFRLTKLCRSSAK